MAKTISRREQHETNLYNAGHTITNILCDRCGDEQDFIDEAFEASLDAYKKGWRATDKKVYCPTCAKKFKIK